MIEASVAIPARNASHTIMACLHAFETQTFPLDRFEVIVADDGSTDDTASLVDSYARNAPYKISLIRRSAAALHGAGLARNEALLAGKGSVLLSTDADCLVDKRWLEIGVAAIRNGATIIVGHVDTPEILLFPWKVAPVGRALTGSCAMKKEVIANFSFSQEFPGLVGDDVDFFSRLEDAGFPPAYEPSFRIIHPVKYYDAPTLFARAMGRSNEVLLHKKYGDRVRSCFHPLFWPWRGKVSPAFAATVAGLILLIAPFLLGTFFKALLFVMIVFSVAAAWFLASGYRYCIAHAPSGHTKVSVKDRLHTLFALALYLPVVAFARLRGSWHYRHLFL